MATSKAELKDRLARYKQINISVAGRKTGRMITVPVWFVFEDNRLDLLPVRGSPTQWYQNLLQNPEIQIDARGAKATFRAKPITAPSGVSAVVEEFREKYGASEVKKYYSNFDVAVLVDLD